MKGVGRIASADEAPLYFRTAGRVRAVGVEPLQRVSKGDVLAELESGQLGVQIEIARVNLQMAELRADQEARSVQLAGISSDSAVRLAAANLAGAQADLSRALAEQTKAAAELENRRSQPVTVGSTIDRRVADARVQTERARLAAASAPASASDVAAAQQALATARADAQRAQRDLEHAKAGYTPIEIRAQQGSVEAAKNALYAAQVERDAMRGRKDDAGAATAEARVSAAQAELDAANDRLKMMQQGGSDADVASAQKTLDASQAEVSAAEERLAAVQAGPRPEEVKVAESAVHEAEAYAQLVRDVEAGVPSAVESARAYAEAAAGAAKAAGAAVDAAQAAYDRAVAEAKIGGKGDFDKAIAQKNLEVARLSLKALEDQLEDAKLRATRDGIVTQLNVRVGDLAQAYAPVAAIADPAKLEVALDLSSADAAKVSVGQEAKVSLDGVQADPLIEKVTSVPAALEATVGSSAASQPRTVHVSLAPNAAGAALGGAASVAISTQKKGGVLLVPSGAVKLFGGRRLVQVVEPDGRRRDVEVGVGLTGEADIEITDGLSEGQVVVAS